VPAQPLVVITSTLDVFSEHAVIGAALIGTGMQCEAIVITVDPACMHASSICWTAADLQICIEFLQVRRCEFNLDLHWLADWGGGVFCAQNSAVCTQSGLV
jgi:hypothetical protein